MEPMLQTLLISLRISLATTAAVLIVGLPLAWGLSRRGWRGRNVVDVLVNLPLALPPTVLGYYLLLLLGRHGPVGAVTVRLWGSTLLFTQGAAIVAAVTVSLPLFVQAARNSFEGIPQEILEAAQLDGAGRLAAFQHLVVPLAWPGVVTGLLLAYARSLGEFGATLMVAGNVPGRTQTMSLAVYSAVQAGETQRAHILAIVLTGVAAVSMWIALRWRVWRWNDPLP